MTQTPDMREPTRTEENIAQELRLRPDPPRVMRLSRRAIALATAIGGLGLGVILIVALQNNRQEGNPDRASFFHRNAFRRLKGCPHCLGTTPMSRVSAHPCPVSWAAPSLGRKIAASRSRHRPFPGPLAPTVDPEEQRRLQELDAARLSALFAEAQNRAARRSNRPQPDAPRNRRALPLHIGRPDGKRSGLKPGGVPHPSRRHGHRQCAAHGAGRPAPTSLQAGTVIPAALITGLRSDLPGQISAQVTGDVYDSPSGRYPADPARRAPAGRIRQPHRIRPKPSASGLDPPHPSGWSLHCAGTRARH